MGGVEGYGEAGPFEGHVRPWRRRLPPGKEEGRRTCWLKDEMEQKFEVFAWLYLEFHDSRATGLEILKFRLPRLQQFSNALCFRLFLSGLFFFFFSIKIIFLLLAFSGRDYFAYQIAGLFIRAFQLIYVLFPPRFWCFSMIVNRRDCDGLQECGHLSCRSLPSWPYPTPATLWLHSWGPTTSLKF